MLAPEEAPPDGIESNNSQIHSLKERIGLPSPQKSIDTDKSVNKIGSSLKASSLGGDVDVCNALLGLKDSTPPNEEEDIPHKTTRVSFAPTEEMQKRAQDYLKLFERSNRNASSNSISHRDHLPAPGYPHRKRLPPQSSTPNPPQIQPESFFGTTGMQMPSGGGGEGEPIAPFTPARMAMFAVSMAQYWSAMAVVAKQHLQHHEAEIVQLQQAQRSQARNKRGRFDNNDYVVGGDIISGGRTPTSNMQMPAHDSMAPGANLQFNEGSRLFQSTTGDGEYDLPLPVTKENVASSNNKKRARNDEESIFASSSLQAQRFGSVSSMSVEARRIHDANSRHYEMLDDDDDDSNNFNDPSEMSDSVLQRYNLLPRSQMGQMQQVMTMQQRYPSLQQSSSSQQPQYSAFDDESDNDPPPEDNSEDGVPKASRSSAKAPRARGTNGTNIASSKVSFYAWDAVLIDQVKDRPNHSRVTRVCSMEEWLACFEDCNAITREEYHILEGLVRDPNIDRIVESLRQAARHNNRKNDALYKKAFGWDYLKDQMKIGRTQLITTIYWTTYVIYLYHHPAMQHLKMDRETFLNERVDRSNPHFQNIDNLEIERLLQFRNSLICAFQIIPPHRNEVMMLKVGACMERSGRKYQISSSGQMLSTTRRRTLYRIEAAAFESNSNSGETPITAYITNPNHGRDIDITFGNSKQA